MTEQLTRCTRRRSRPYWPCAVALSSVGIRTIFNGAGAFLVPATDEFQRHHPSVVFVGSIGKRYEGDEII